MYFSRSLLASAIVLSFSTCVKARVAQHKLETEATTELKEKKSENNGLFRNWPAKNIPKKRQGDQFLDCSTPNVYIDILNNAQDEDTQTFCNRWLGMSPATTVLETTPTMTMTTTDRKTNIVTSTTRILITEIEVVTTPANTTASTTASTTADSLQRRGPNYAAKYAAVNGIFSSVLESGVTTAASPENTARVDDANGLSNACSCKNVDPTATVTSTFVAPAVSTTVGNNRVILLTVTSTKTFTTTVSANSSFTVAANSSVSVPFASGSSTESPAASDSISQQSSAVSGGAFNSTAASAFITAPPASITARPSITLISTGSIAPSDLPVGPRGQVVVGFPFSCPNTDAVNPRFIVGENQYEYIVLCDKAIVTSNEITTINDVEDQTACAVLCSLLNYDSQGRVCDIASFTAVPGTKSGSCLLSGPTENVVDQPGSITILLAGVSSSTNDGCNAIDSNTTPSNVTVEPAALLDSVTSVDYSLSIPGFQTRSETGGVFRTFYSSGYTDSLGWYYYSWYDIYASSSAWYEIYATSWSSCANAPRTLVAPNATTIIDGAGTTIISGISTYSITNGNGALPPTAVPVSITDEAVAITIGSSTATTSSVGGIGSQAPSPGFTISGAASSQVGVNGTGSQGSAALTRSGESATFRSTGGAGAVPPPSATAQSESSSVIAANSTGPPSGSGAFTISGAISTSNFTAGGGSLGPVPTSGGVQVTFSSETYTITSIGSVGAVPPTPTNGSFVETLSSATAISNSTGLAGSGGPSSAIGGTSGEVTFVTSSSTATYNFTGGSGGYGTQVVSTSIGQPANSTGIAGTSGAAQFTLSGNTASAFSTGGFGSQGPALPTSNSTASFPAASGSLVVSLSGSTATFFSTGGGGAQPPSPTSGVILTTGTGAGAPIPSANASLPGSQGFSISGGTAFTSATQGSGAIPPSGNASSPAPASLTPSPSINGSATAGTGVFSTGGETFVSFGTGSFGAIPPPSASVAPTPSLNASLPAPGGTGIFSTGGSASVILSTGASNAIPPTTANLSTTASAGTAPVPSGSLYFPLSSGTAISLSTGGSGAISPIANLTATASLTPIPSLNASSATDAGFSNVDSPRTGGSNRTSTAPIGTGTAPPILVDSTTLSGLSESSSTSVYGGYGPPPDVTSPPSPESTLITSGPSVTVPPVSANSTLPTSDTTDDNFSNDEDDRRRRSRSSTLLPTPVGSSAVPVPSSNTTLPSTGAPVVSANSTQAPVGTASSSLPAPSLNSTAPANATAVSTSYVTVTLLTGSSAIPQPSANASIPAGSASLTISSLTANATSAFGTGVASVSPTQAANTTLPLSTGGTASVILPTVSLNSSTAVGSGTGSTVVSATLPLPPANSTAFLPTGTASSSFLAPPANITDIFNTYTVGPSSSVDLPANSTGVFATGTSVVGTGVSSGLPIPSSNLTIPSSLQTSSPSTTPVFPSNSSDEACPTASFSTLARVEIITTTYFETVPIGSSTCLSTASVTPIQSANSTFPTGTGPASNTAPAPTAPTTPDPLPNLILPGNTLYRRSGEIATQEQIDNVCNYAENLVFNPNFAIYRDNAALGWSTSSQDPTVSFRTAPFASPANLTATNSSAHVLIAVPGRSLTVSQPLTLCPGKQYQLTSFNRQTNLLAKCTVEYLIGDQSIYTTSPQETFLQTDDFFTAGLTKEDVSKDLKIVAKCDGESGAVAGADEEGWMSVEFDGIGVTKEDQR